MRRQPTIKTSLVIYDPNSQRSLSAIVERVNQLQKQNHSLARDRAALLIALLLPLAFLLFVLISSGD
jgi:hypothetical protein